MLYILFYNLQLEEEERQRREAEQERLRLEEEQRQAALIKIRELEEEHRRLEEERRRREEELKRAMEEEARQKAEEERLKAAHEEEARINKQAEDAFAIIGDLDNALKGFTETLGLSDVCTFLLLLREATLISVHACGKFRS